MGSILGGARDSSEIGGSDPAELQAIANRSTQGFLGCGFRTIDHGTAGLVLPALAARCGLG